MSYKPVYYENDDYFIRSKLINKRERYFIKFHSQSRSQEIEIDKDMFDLYFREFNKPLENCRNEHRRHIEDGDMDNLIQAGKLTPESMETECVMNMDLNVVLEKCTPTQRRRFELYRFHKYTLDEIAAMENCGRRRIEKSIKAAVEKVEKYFS